MRNSNLKSCFTCFGLLALVTFLILGIGCAATQSQASPTPTQEPLPSVTQSSDVSSNFDFVAAVERIAPSVVVINTDLSGFGAVTNSGTGWIIDSNGVIVTNNHVVAGANTIQVTLSDGRSFKAQAVRTNEQKDLAVIKIAANNLPVVAIGNSSALKVGQPVAAIGNALDLGIIMTGGWVSRLNVSVSGPNNVQIDGLIETDAAINPGNSGGPLVTRDGLLVGITNAALIQTATDPDIEGIYYAISIDSAMPTIQSLISELP